MDTWCQTPFSTLAIVNLCLGIVAVGLAWLVGLPNPLLWGVLAGTVSFIPYLGPAIMVATKRPRFASDHCAGA